MAVRILCVLVVAFAASAFALDSLDNIGVRIAMKVFEDCNSKSEGLSPCLKKKALTFLDRIGRMEKLDITDEITVVKAPEAAVNSTPLTEDLIDKEVPRSLANRDQALTDMLWGKVTSVLRSKNIEISTPRMSDIGFEEARKGDLGLGGGGKGKGGKGGGKKGGGMMMHMMMGMMGKMMGMIPLGIAGLFLLAGKALITSKIALLLSGIIAIKKLVAAKHGGGGGGHGGGAHHVWASGGGGGGGWDRRSLDDSQKLAYSSYAPH